MGFLDKIGVTYLTTRLRKYFATKGYVSEAVDQKQDKLVSGTNIKTINNSSILGPGNINIQGGGVTSVNGKTGNVYLDYSDVGALWDGTEYVSSVNGSSGSISIKTVNSKSLMGSGNVDLTASDVGALPSNTTYVSTVNGQSGAVTTTDEKLLTTALAGSTTTTHYPILGENSQTASTKNYTSLLSYKREPDVYKTTLSIGGGSGLNRWAGYLQLFGNGAGGTTIKPQTLGSAINVTLPDKSGTVALTDDIPSAVSDLTNDLVYDLGTVTPGPNGTFIIADADAEAVADMWGEGLCAVTFNQGGDQYYAIKQDLLSLYGISFMAFIGAWGAVPNGEPAAGTVALGVSVNKAEGVYIGIFLKRTEIDQDGAAQVVLGYGARNVDTPVMDSTASVGVSDYWARADHSHPTDTSRQATLVSGTNIKTVGGTSILGSGNIALPTKTSDLTNDSGFVTSDTKVTQTVTTTTDYTYWRGLCVGSSSSQAETGSLSTTTDQVRIFSNIRVQPSTGTLKATTFKGQLSGTIASSTTATTQASTDNSTKVATTAFVKSVLPAGLPSVSSSDNGKVLMVVNGAWAAASLPVYNGGVV